MVLTASLYTVKSDSFSVNQHVQVVEDIAHNDNAVEHWRLLTVAAIRWAEENPELVHVIAKFKLTGDAALLGFKNISTMSMRGLENVIQNMIHVEDPLLSIHASVYKAYLQKYSKTFFDVYCRAYRIVFRITDSLSVDQEPFLLETSVAQLYMFQFILLYCKPSAFPIMEQNYDIEQMQRDRKSAARFVRRRTSDPSSSSTTDTNKHENSSCMVVVAVNRSKKRKREQESTFSVDDAKVQKRNNGTKLNKSLVYFRFFFPSC